MASRELCADVMLVAVGVVPIVPIVPRIFIKTRNRYASVVVPPDSLSLSRENKQYNNTQDDVAILWQHATGIT